MDGLRRIRVDGPGWFRDVPVPDDTTMMVVVDDDDGGWSGVFVPTGELGYSRAPLNLADRLFERAARRLRDTQRAAVVQLMRRPAA